MYLCSDHLGTYLFMKFRNKGDLGDYKVLWFTLMSFVILWTYLCSSQSFALKGNIAIPIVITRKCWDLDEAKAPCAKFISVVNPAIGSTMLYILGNQYRYRTGGGYAAEVYVRDHHNHIQSIVPDPWRVATAGSADP
jgi:hypothetical protein